MRIVNRSVGRISRYRRGPVAGLIVVLAGLLLSGGLYSVFSPASAEQTRSDDELVAEGRQLFLVSCSFCHGRNGEGVRVSTEGNVLGPSLIGVGSAAVDFQVGTGRMPLTQPGAYAPRKERVFTDEETAALAAYVASLGPGPSVPKESDYSIAGLSEEAQQEAIVRGGLIFRTNCTACHNFQGAGGAMPHGGAAPVIIKGVSDKHIYEAMLTGPGNMDNFSNGNLTPDEKRDVIAYINSMDENPDYGGFGMGGLGPVAEGVFVWVVGIGCLVGFAIWIAAATTRSQKARVRS